MDDKFCFDIEGEKNHSFCLWKANAGKKPAIDQFSWVMWSALGIIVLVIIVLTIKK